MVWAGLIQVVMVPGCVLNLKAFLPSEDGAKVSYWPVEAYRRVMIRSCKTCETSNLIDGPLLDLPDIAPLFRFCFSTRQLTLTDFHPDLNLLAGRDTSTISTSLLPSSVLFSDSPSSGSDSESTSPFAKSGPKTSTAVTSTLIFSYLLGQ